MPRPRTTEPPAPPVNASWRRRPSDPLTIAYAIDTTTDTADLWRRVEDYTGPRVFHRVCRRPWVPESDDRAPMSGWREVRGLVATTAPAPSASPASVPAPAPR